jgi:hypothetical protein
MNKKKRVKKYNGTFLLEFIFLKFFPLEVIAKVRNLPFDKLRVNGLRLKSFTFSVRGELVEPQKNTFAIGSSILKKPQSIFIFMERLGSPFSE